MCCELFTDEENMMKMFQSLQRTKSRSHTDPSPLLPQPKEFKRPFGLNWTITATKEPKRSGSGTFPDASQAQEGRRPEAKLLSCFLRCNMGMRRGLSLPESLTLTLMRLNGKTAILKFPFLIKRRSFPHSARPAKQNLPQPHFVHSR